MIRRAALALALSLLATAASLGAQAAPAAADAAATDGAAAPGAPAAATPAPDAAAPADAFDTPLVREALPVEIATSSYYELVAMAKALGLSTAGSAEDIRGRLYEHYGLEMPAPAEEAGRTITIERASEASYAKVVEDGGVIRASGGVVLAFTDESGNSHRIEADKIAYDRATSSVTARGSVRYERKSGGTTELFTGEALSADLEDWSGIFLDGRIRRSGTSQAASGGAAGSAAAGTAEASKGERGVVVSASAVRKKSAEVMVLEDGVVSGCDADDPHYSIKADRIWLLGDKEWAVSSAVFSLGNVPVLWLPFFYYPGDELVFHPVIGYRSREGRFVQTTTYLVGRKPKKKDTTTLLTMVDNGPEKPTQLNGVFLRRVSGPSPKDEGSLKLMADAYSALGLFAGLQGSFPKLGRLGKTELFAGVGVSRSLFAAGQGYSPYVVEGDWESVWNGSRLFGLELPFRYGLEFSTSLALGGLSLSLSVPVYSDPYLDVDFRERSEDMDWFKLFSAAETELPSASLRSQLQPKIDASFSASPKGLNPWLKSFSLTKLSSSMTFSTKDKPIPADPIEAALLAVDPDRKFYYPSSLVPFDAAASLKGSLIPGSAAGGSATEGGGDGEARLRSPWDEGEAEAGRDAGGEAAGEGKGEGVLPGMRMPATFGATPRKAAAWSGTADWSLAPSARWEDRYRSESLDGPEDIDFSRQYSLIEYGLAAALDGSLSYGNGTVGGAMGLSFSKRGQERPYLLEDAEAASYRLADYRAASDRLTGTASLSAKPFAGSWLWAASSLSWSMKAGIYSRAFKEMDGDEPVYEESYLGWDDSSITSHNVSMTLAARPGGLSQSLTLTAGLPPTDESYKAVLSLDAGPAGLGAECGMFRDSGGLFEFDPLKATFRLGRASGPRLVNAFVYDPDPGEPVSDSFTASWGPLSASFSAKRAESYTPVAGSGWLGNGDEAFRPAELSASLKPRLAGPEGKGDASWTLEPSLSFSQSLLQFSNSSLSIDLKASLRIGSGFSLSITSQSRNSSAWRYYPGLFREELAAAGCVPEDYYVNPLEDAWSSISVWDEAALRRGLIKMKSLKLEAEQDLHDWTLKVSVEAQPKLEDDGRSYFIDTSFSLLLAWKDFSDIKAGIEADEEGGLRY